ncbi:TPA: hypothetical protein NOS69_000013 [Pseudomonas aeruginosa]|nr:hypothetical protein [Pseudomonas aeruginosa]
MDKYKFIKYAADDIVSSSFYDFKHKIHLTDDHTAFNCFSSFIKDCETKPIGYKAFDLTNATKIRICIIETMSFKSISNLSMLERLSKHIYDNYEEILEKNKKFDFLKTQINVFVDNYKPFDFFKFQEKRLEYKVNISYVENGESKIIKTNLGHLIAIKLRREQFDIIDFDFKEAKNKQVNRKYNTDYIPSFRLRLPNKTRNLDDLDFKAITEKEFIFEFSNKSYYKELIDMINY